jgi:5-methyltetrahydrofolate--homocysteine methyltransferase
MPRMPEVIAALREAGLRDQVKVLVGGAPVSQRYAQEISVDGFGANAVFAVERAKQLMSAQIDT